MRDSQRVCRFAKPASRITKHVAVQNGHHTFASKTARAPTESRANRVWNVTDSQWLGMAAIAPIGVQETDRAMLQPNASGVFQVRFGVVIPSDQCLPGGSAGAD